MSNREEDKIDTRKLYQDQKILDILEQRSSQQDQQYREIYKKSHILHKKSEFKDSKIASESELDDLVNRIRKVEKEKQNIKNYGFTDPEYYQYLIRNNLDLVSTLTIEVSCLLACYPFNTIKTRIQAKHPLEDVCFFAKNNVSKFRNFEHKPFEGIGQGMLSTFSGVFMNNAAYRWMNIEIMKNPTMKQLSTFQKQLLCFCFADLFATPFRLPFEVRKIFLQMNSGEINFNKYVNGMKVALLPSLLRQQSYSVIYFIPLFLFKRDFTFRFGFNTVFQLSLHGHNYLKLYSSTDPFERELIQRHIDKSIPNQGDYNRRITGMVLGSLFGILLSNPFDLTVTRLVAQQYPKYEGFTNCLKTVIREEKAPKLFLSGYWPRTAYHMISGTIIFNFYDTFRQMIGEAYAY